MPVYEYACSVCGVFDAIRAVATRDEPVACPRCESVAPRVRLALPLLPRNADDQSDSADGAYLGRHHSFCNCC
ncbi:FmdB family zinc ribbon protein [Burkholderia sp. Ac-20344]|uniref:FmdB family zinc ribbon protein n=1 Tax=Burkholderia sp. Ac-20344 TaxID=2703890 RepID=UPI00197BD6BC|nr:FmdB family zinc ribbon protein [Burkholderia sp. Ac-20344]MBN3830349.1 zinc ribbon domain-containing protein [Burkholderia sp. Ac-20344]